MNLLRVDSPGSFGGHAPKRSLAAILVDAYSSLGGGGAEARWIAVAAAKGGRIAEEGGGDEEMRTQPDR